MKASLLLLAGLLCSCSALHLGEAPWYPTSEWFSSWMAEGGLSVSGEESFPELRAKFLSRLRSFAADYALQAPAWHESFGFVASGAERVLELAGLHASVGGESPEAAAVLAGAEPERVRVLREFRSNFSADPLDGFHPFGLEKYPYFRFLPIVEGRVMLDGSEASWSAPCFKRASAVAERGEDGDTVTLRFRMDEPTSLLCSDHYLLTTVDGVHSVTFFFRGEHTLTWRLPPASDAARRWDVETKGIRVMRMKDGFIQTAIDILDTVALYIPAETEAGITEAVATRNAYFMEHYANVPMRRRANGGAQVDVPEELIHSGDFLGVIRLDGLDPMLGWAMGSTTGHTTVAMWEEGQLFVMESTVTDSYWPTNGIQKTPYRLWLKQAAAAGYHVVWAPLAADARAAFNATAALDFFHRTEGLDYGYRNLLFGWLDTPQDNYPCLPPDFSSHCMQWEHAELIYGIADRLVPSVGDLIFGQAFNHRVNATGLRAPEVLQRAGDMGIDGPTLPTIVEQDEWVYNTTRNGQPAVGPSQVCCVFVCNMWKAGGLFDAQDRQVNCAELTNWDDYALTVLDPSPERPPQCQAADPSNALCQLMGEYELHLNSLATKDPYEHMAERCPTRGPDYKKPADC